MSMRLKVDGGWNVRKAEAIAGAEVKKGGSLWVLGLPNPGQLWLHGEILSKEMEGLEREGEGLGAAATPFNMEELLETSSGRWQG